MTQTPQAVRGMSDILPPRTAAWRRVETELTAILRAYGYREIRLPLVENTAIFERSIGDLTDIVQKEMYTFADRNGDRLTLRPEGTAGCVRAVLQHGLIHNQVQRLWYAGPMFRHERPQKGRYRQFHQIGVEAFGMAGPDIEAELILMSARMWKVLGIDGLRLEINTLGAAADRAAYRAVLREHFARHHDQLDADSRARLDRNPLRILDSKAAEMQSLIAAAPPLEDRLSSVSRAHFAALRARLDAAGIAYRVNPHLVRGLDYYADTVFEWITERLGAQGTVCAGGRYDGLVELLGGRPTPAAGFALGMERLIEMLEQTGMPALPGDADIYIVSADSASLGTALAVGEKLRSVNPGLATVCDCSGGSLKSQMKKADRSGARVALIIGEEEHDQGAVTVKPLRAALPQRRVPIDELDAGLAPLLAD